MKYTRLTSAELTAILMAAATAYNPTKEASEGLAKLSKLANEFITNQDPSKKAYEFEIRPFKPPVTIYTYYRIEEDVELFCPDTNERRFILKNELVTEYFYKKYAKYAKGIKAALVKVPAESCYYSFGARFSTIFDQDND